MKFLRIAAASFLPLRGSFLFLRATAKGSALVGSLGWGLGAQCHGIADRLQDRLQKPSRSLRYQCRNRVVRTDLFFENNTVLMHGRPKPGCKNRKNFEKNTVLTHGICHGMNYNRRIAQAMSRRAERAPPSARPFRGQPRRPSVCPSVHPSVRLSGGSLIITSCTSSFC
jgi:hypothetical protein